MIDTSGVSSGSKDVELAHRIAAYWLSKGYNVDVRVRAVSEPLSRPGGFTSNYHAVRSNLRAGLPQGYRPDTGMHA